LIFDKKEFFFIKENWIRYQIFGKKKSIRCFNVNLHKFKTNQFSKSISQVYLHKSVIKSSIIFKKYFSSPIIIF
jgi:hypothetical protein